MSPATRTIAHVGVLVAVAVVLGVGSNALRSDGLPLIRKPLSETRAVVKREQLMATNPMPIQEPKPTTGGRPPVDEPAQANAATEKPTKQKPEPAKPKSQVTQVVKPTQPPTLETKKPEPSAKKVQALFTNLADAKACFDNKSAIFLDARAVEDYEAEHIVGALWLGYESFEEDYDRVLGAIPKDRLLITYCSDQQCSSAIKLADALVALGHTRVVIMLEGLPGWTDAGYPTASGMKAGD